MMEELLDVSICRVETLKIFGLTDAKSFLDQAFQKVFLFKNMGISQLLITLEEYEKLNSFRKALNFWRRVGSNPR